MRPAESEYWDGQARRNKGNPWKRRAQAEKIFGFTWFDERVLEIGTGAAEIAAALKVINMGHLKYIGTDVSGVWCKQAKSCFGLNVVQADILDLPEIDGGFTRVLALDSLEHVRPEDREEGYKTIGERMADQAIMLINMPLNVSYHSDEFDHFFGFGDIDRLCRLGGMYLKKYEEYGVDLPKGRLYYGWVVLQKVAS